MSRFTPKSSDLLNYERHSLWRPAIQVKDMRSGSVSARPLGGDSSGVRGSKGFGRGAAHLPGGRAEHEADHEVDAAFGDRGCGGPLEGPRRRRRRVGRWRAGRAPAESPSKRPSIVKRASKLRRILPYESHEVKWDARIFIQKLKASDQVKRDIPLLCTYANIPFLGRKPLEG